MGLGTSAVAKQKPRRRLLVALIIVAVVIVGSGTALAVVSTNHSSSSSSSNQNTARELSPGPPSAGPTTSSGPGASTATNPPSAAAARQEATTIAGYINMSKVVRPDVSAAIAQVASCEISPAKGQATLAHAISVRDNAVQNMTALPQGLPNGDQIVGALSTALRDSATADQDYRAWMSDVANGRTTCGSDPTTDNNYNAGQAESMQATTAKVAFLALWNPIAPTYDQPTFQQGDF